jgi:uncharacterized membrane protein YdjX (TVP38/TMEM64 family)
MKLLKYFGILTVLSSMVACFYYYDLGGFLTLDYLKAQKDYLLSMIQASPYLSVAVFSTIYIATTALSLPGATILTLAAGALFGLLKGTVIVSFASTLGATCAFLASRYLIGNLVQQKFGDRLKAINKGVEEEGAFYLFTMRLVPVFPFFMINLLMGITSFSVKRFFLVSQIGMLPGTAVYVNAGTQLGQLQSLQGIISPSLLLSFALLGIFPIAVKKFILWLKG